MRGYPQLNFPKFLSAAEALRDKKYMVWSPAEIEIDNGFDYKLGKWFKERTQREIAKDGLIALITYADMVVVLPGWRKSKGAMAEVHVAKSLDIPVYEFSDVMTDNMRKVLI